MGARPEIRTAIVAAGVAARSLGSFRPWLAIYALVLLRIVGVSACSGGDTINEGAWMQWGEDLVRARTGQGAVLPGTKKDPNV
jgi:hypothetical protein